MNECSYCGHVVDEEIVHDACKAGWEKERSFGSCEGWSSGKWES